MEDRSKSKRGEKFSGEGDDDVFKSQGDKSSQNQSLRDDRRRLSDVISEAKNW